MRCFGYKNSLGLRSAISVSQPWKGKRTPSWCLILVVVSKATFCSRLSNPTYYSLTHYPHKPTILTAPLLLALPSPLPLLLSDPVRCFVSVWLPLEISISDDFCLFFPLPSTCLFNTIFDFYRNRITRTKCPSRTVYSSPLISLRKHDG